VIRSVSFAAYLGYLQASVHCYNRSDVEDKQSTDRHHHHHHHYCQSRSTVRIVRSARHVPWSSYNAANHISVPRD